MTQKIFFRGEANTFNLLTPTIMRIPGNNKPMNSYIEENLYRHYLDIDFFNLHLSSKAMNELTLEERLVFLSQLQHYGYPTRLIDVSRSYSVAEYFACSLNEHINSSGQIYTFNVGDQFLNDFKTQTVKRLLDLIFDFETFSLEAKKLTKNYLRAFKRSFSRPVFLESILDVNSKHKQNMRITKQKGAFILMNNIIENLPNNQFSVSENIQRFYPKDQYNLEIIHSHQKVKRLVRLAFRGIHRLSLFPDADDVIRIEKQLASYIAYNHELKSFNFPLQSMFSDLIELILLKSSDYKDKYDTHNFVAQYNEKISDVFTILRATNHYPHLMNCIKFLKGDLEPYIESFIRNSNLLNPLYVLNEIKISVSNFS